ncbi:MAG: hypothetical protein IIA62_06945 [Nitrospinae bacterium]|nr:hypothetical protein [Nitrospinota bacterium]
MMIDRTAFCLPILLTVMVHLAAPPPGESAPPSSGQPLEILRITPAGEDVSPGRQIVIKFNRPVVPLGRMQRSREEIPIRVTPSLNCEWRWLNASALACQLGEKDALRSSTRYRIAVEPGIQAEDGATMAKTVRVYETGIQSNGWWIMFQREERPEGNISGL